MRLTGWTENDVHGESKYMCPRWSRSNIIMTFHFDCYSLLPQYDAVSRGFVMRDVARAIARCDDLLTALPIMLLASGARVTPEMLREAHPVVLKALKPYLPGEFRPTLYQPPLQTLWWTFGADTIPTSLLTL